MEYDWKVVISLIAMVITVFATTFNAYMQYFQKYKLKILVSDPLKLFYGTDSNLFLHANLTFLNEGAMNCPILSLEILLEGEKIKNSERFIFRAFLDSSDFGLDKGIYEPKFFVKTLAKPFIVSKRDAIVETIKFSSINSLKLEAGTYTLSFRVIGGNNNDVLTSLSKVFSINEKNATFLNQHCHSDKETKRSKNSLSLVYNNTLERNS